jgi:hypothetical protein
MALSPNYGWAEPDNSSLVKNGAQDIRALGDAIDTSVWNAGYGQAGKNKIINGDFAINQRSFTTASGGYGFDRWNLSTSGGTATYTPQTFTLGAAPVAGYEAKNFARLATTVGNDFCRLEQKIESVRTFAGQTATISFWAKGTNPTTAGNLAITLQQFFGTGGSPSAQNLLTQQTFVLTANWTRYSFTFAVPSISGKTLGTAGDDCLGVWIGQGTSTSADAWTLDLWGVQVEYGSKATPFQLAGGGDPQSELAMCQRYYWRTTLSTYNYAPLALGMSTSTTQSKVVIPFPVQMRVEPTSIDYASLFVSDLVNYTVATTAVAIDTMTRTNATIIATVASGLTQYRTAFLTTSTANTGYLGFNGEL